MDERRRAAWRALGLGPVWVARDRACAVEPAPQAPADAVPSQAQTPPHGQPLPPPPPALLQPLELFEPPPEALRQDAPAAAPADALVRLDALREVVAGCPKCRLCQSRTRTVFGVGDPRARWMFIGEAPGAEEDARGDPFVGQAGRLLDAMLASIGLDRGRDVYIANVIKCRPPGNRNPQPDEVASCEPYLREQIALVRPALLVLLGRFAAQSLLRTQAPIGALRGRVHRYEGAHGPVPAIVTYHPAYLLRAPLDKAKAWRDLCLACEEFARQRPAAVAA